MKFGTWPRCVSLVSSLGHKYRQVTNPLNNTKNQPLFSVLSPTRTRYHPSYVQQQQKLGFLPLSIASWKQSNVVPCHVCCGTAGAFAKIKILSFRVNCGAAGCVRCLACSSGFYWSSWPPCNRLTGSPVCVATRPARPRPVAPETRQDTPRYSPFSSFR